MQASDNGVAPARFATVASAPASSSEPHGFGVAAVTPPNASAVAPSGCRRVDVDVFAASSSLERRVVAAHDGVRDLAGGTCPAQRQRHATTSHEQRRAESRGHRRLIVVRCSRSGRCCRRTQSWCTPYISRMLSSRLPVGTVGSRTRGGDCPSACPTRRRSARAARRSADAGSSCPCSSRTGSSEWSSSVPSPSGIDFSFSTKYASVCTWYRLSRAYCAMRPGSSAWCEPPWKLMSVPLSGYTRPVRSRA